MTIGNSMDTVFLSVPVEALDILTNLANGKTVGEAQHLYEKKYGEIPDIKSFLELLEHEGFISASPTGEREFTPPAAAPQPSAQAESHRSHFSYISPALARRIWSRPVLMLGCLLIGLALTLICFDPSLIPPASVFVFPQHLTLLSLALTALVFLSVFLHELGHLVAARAAGVPSWLSLSHRLWFLVAQTDMTGIWRAPKRARYIALLAGALVDAVSAAILIMLLWGDRHGWLTFNPTAKLLTQAFLLTYLLRLLWQCYLFMRTDFYYVIATALKCKSLMADTESFLLNQLARIVPRIRRIDQSAIPSREMRVIRCYSLIWLVGRSAAFVTLFLITLPVLWGYGVRIVSILTGDHSTRYEIIDALILASTAGGTQVAGLWLWIHSLYNARKERSDGLATR